MFSRRGVLRSSRAAKRYRKILLWRFILAIVFLLTVIYGISFLSKLDSINISKINVSGYESVEVLDVVKIVKEDIFGNYLGLLSKSNFLLYPKSKIIKDVYANFPAVKDVSVTREDKKTISVVLTERKPFALLCADYNASPDSSTNCFLFDEEGFIFTKAPQFSGSVYVVFSGENFPKEPLRLNIGDFTDLSLLKIFIKEVGSLGFEVNDFDINKQYVTANLKNSGKILFKNTSDLPTALENLKIFLDKTPDIIKDGNLDVSYIDIRLANKIFYK